MQDDPALIIKSLHESAEIIKVSLPRRDREKVIDGINQLIADALYGYVQQAADLANGRKPEGMKFIKSGGAKGLLEHMHGIAAQLPEVRPAFSAYIDTLAELSKKAYKSVPLRLVETQEALRAAV